MFSGSWILEGFVWQNIFIAAIVVIALITGKGKKQF